MRKLYLWWQNTRKYILLDAFLLFTITVALYSFSNALGTYRMMIFSADLLDNAIENKKSVYYMELIDIEDYFENTPEENVTYNKERYKDIAELRHVECIEAVHTRYIMSALDESGEVLHNIGIYDKKSVEIFPEPYRGSWSSEPMDENGYFNAVVYGSQYKGIELGSIITAYDDAGKEMKIKVSGEIYESLPIPMYNGYGSYSTADMIYSNEANGVIIFECDEIMDSVWQDGITEMSPQADLFIIEFRKDATGFDMGEVLDKLSKSGGISYMDDLIDGSIEYAEEIFKTKMTVPIFYTIISFCAFLCITILYIIKRTKELAVYHLLGYSKSRMALSTVLRIVLIISSAAVINIAYVENYYYLLAKDIITRDIRPPYFDSTSTWLIIAICAAMLVTSVVIAICTLYSRAPIDIQRSSKE